jgi:hypothetical protein
MSAPTLDQLLRIAERDLGARVSFVTAIEPTTKVDLLSFGLELAYAIEAQAKRENQAANEEYATKPYSTYAQDCAYEECQRTAVLADAADDLVMFMEDALYDATRGTV